MAKKGNVSIDRVNSGKWAFHVSVKSYEKLEDGTVHGVHSFASNEQDLKDLHYLIGELLETETVKEPIPGCSWCGPRLGLTPEVPIVLHLYGCPNKVTPPSNSEKEEVKEEEKKFLLKGIFTPPDLPLDGKIEIVPKEEPTTPEKKCCKCGWNVSPSPSYRCCCPCHQ